MLTQPLVSILINCFNGEKYLSEAIDSVLSQTYENWEVIFWDNQSTDNSAKIFKSYQDRRLKYFLAPTHENLAAARKEAMKKISGDWVGILDTDDIWSEEKLSKQIDLLSSSRYQNLGLIYGKCMHFSDKEEYTVYKYSTFHPSGMIFDELLYGNSFVSWPSVFFSRKAYNAAGGFNPDYPIATDYDLILKISMSYSVDYIPDTIAYYRIHEDNLLGGNIEQSFKEQYKILGSYYPNPLALKMQNVVIARNTVYNVRTKNYKAALNTLKMIRLSGLFFYFTGILKLISRREKSVHMTGFRG